MNFRGSWFANTRSAHRALPIPARLWLWLAQSRILIGDGGDLELLFAGRELETDALAQARPEQGTSDRRGPAHPKPIRVGFIDADDAVGDQAILSADRDDGAEVYLPAFFWSSGRWRDDR